MFDSLADQIKHDEPVTRIQMVLKWAGILAIAVLLFSGLIVAVRFLGE